MVYKNEFKQYVMMGCLGGLFYGCLMSLSWKNAAKCIIAGIIFAVLWTLFQVLFSKYAEKKAEQLRAEISKIRNIICEGPASHLKGKTGWTAISGWLFLSEDAIEFYQHKGNFGGRNIPILLNDIVSVEAKGRLLTIHTKTETYKFIVSKAELWKKSITEIL